MKLLCPKCKRELSKKEISLRKGIAHCEICNELFKIADFITNSEEIRRVQKPISTNIILNTSYDCINIEIPPKRWSTQTVVFMFASVFVNISLFILLVNSIEASITLAFIPFLLVAIFISLYTAFLISGKTEIHYNKELISVTWIFIRIKHSKKQASSGLKKITEVALYTTNHQPVYGIGLFFKNGKKIKFGSNLNEDERKWLIGELYELKASYNDEH